MCWRFCALGEHFASACSLDLPERADSVMANFENLTTEQNVRVPWEMYVALKGYVTGRMRHTAGGIENTFSKTVPPADSMCTLKKRSISFMRKE